MIRLFLSEDCHSCRARAGIGLQMGDLCHASLWVRRRIYHVPVCGISLYGILSGTAIALITMLLASRTPAKRITGMPVTRTIQEL